MNKNNLLLLLLLLPLSIKAEIYNIKNFGAKADAKSINTINIQNAIDECSKNGGGTIFFEKGTYVTGTILLKNNVTIELAPQAKILGSTNPLDYKVIDAFVDATGQQRGACLICGVNVTNVGIKGEGIIDGRGESYQQYNISQICKPQSINTKEWKNIILNRPFLLRFIKCNNIKLENIELREPAAWTCHLYQCKNITIKNLTIFSHAHQNNDGVDIDSSSDINISGCYIDTGDDAICIKATSSMPVNNVIVKNSILKSDWGAIKLGTESMGDFNNITYDSCKIFNTKGGGIKILTVDGANINNLRINNIDMCNVDMPIFIRLGERLRTYRNAKKRLVGSMQNIILSNIKAVINKEFTTKVSPASGILITGTRNHKIENVTLHNICIELPGGGKECMSKNIMPENEKMYPEFISFGITPAYGLTARHIKTLKLKDIKFKCKIPDQRPQRKFIDVDKIE